MEDANTTEFPRTNSYNITCFDVDVRSRYQTMFTVQEVVDIYISSAFIIFGILGNIVSFKILHSMKSSASLILKALAITDSLYLLIMTMRVYESICFISSGYVFRVNVSKAIFEVCLKPVTCMVQTASAWLIVLVTVGRYLAVKKPVQAKVMFTEKRVKLLIFLICVLSICMYVPMYFEVEFREVFNNVDCRVELGFIYTRLYLNKMYYLSYRVITEGSIRFIIPLTVLIILNSRLALGIRKAQKQRSVMMADGMRSHQRQSDSITVMVVMVVTIFVICQAPYIFMVMQRLSYRLDPPFKILPGPAWRICVLVSHFLLILNSSVNFLIYVAVGKKFRQKLFRCCRRRSRDSLHVHSGPVTSSTLPVTSDTH